MLEEKSDPKENTAAKAPAGRQPLPADKAAEEGGVTDQSTLQQELLEAQNNLKKSTNEFYEARKKYTSRNKIFYPSTIASSLAAFTVVFAIIIFITPSSNAGLMQAFIDKFQFALSLAIAAAIVPLIVSAAVTTIRTQEQNDYLSALNFEIRNIRNDIMLLRQRQVLEKEKTVAILTEVASKEEEKPTSKEKTVLIENIVTSAGYNRRITYGSTSPKNEPSIAINPLNPYNIVVGCSHFTNPSKFESLVITYITFDGGESWIESKGPLTLLSGWTGISRPSLTWDNEGNAYLAVIAEGPNPETPIGIAVYKSTDSGRTWGPPNLIHTSTEDDRQWIVADRNQRSSYFDYIYVVWDEGHSEGHSKLAFARSTDNGVTWKGEADTPAGTALSKINDSHFPRPSIAADGTIYIAWNAGNTIKLIKSTDGGESFSSPIVAAQGITNLDRLPVTDGWNHFPYGTFRVEGSATLCPGADECVLVAWPDLREDVSRIYYRRSTDGGKTWQGPSSGQPLLIDSQISDAKQDHFMPQLISTPSGQIGCAFYEFGPRGTEHLIDVVLAVSTDNGQSFSERVTVTDYPWDPTVGAPFSHGNPNVTFIGEYFGLDASKLGFYLAWTDTRTGMQEIFTARIFVNPTKSSQEKNPKSSTWRKSTKRKVQDRQVWTS